MILFPRVTVVLVCLSAACLQGPPVPSQEPGAKIWVGRYQEIEEYLRTAECMSMEVFAQNSATRCTLRLGGPVARMAWRAWPPGLHRGFWESGYKGEIAAYELDKLLKMDMVPPTVERQLQGTNGAAQLWVENILVVKPGEPPGESYRTEWESQIVRMMMFDNLIGNRDRNPGNMLRDAAWHLILVDHSRAFGTGVEPPHKLRRIDDGYWGRIERLTRDQLDTALGAWLDDNQIKAILDRREKMRAEIRLLPR
jgi:hypothetical protein